MIVLWNTIYTEAVLEQLRKEGYPVNEEDKARLSPLIHDHINTQGRLYRLPSGILQFCPRFKGQTLVAVHDLSAINSCASA